MLFGLFVLRSDQEEVKNQTNQDEGKKAHKGTGPRRGLGCLSQCDVPHNIASYFEHYILDSEDSIQNPALSARMVCRHFSMSW